MPAIHKQRVGLIVQDKLHLSKPVKTPEEMKHLMNRYDELVKQLKSLMELLKKQKETMSKYHESRVQVVRHLAIMAGTSPIKMYVEGNEEGGYKTIHNALKASATKWEEHFDEEVVKKVAAWESAVSERVNNSEKLCHALRRDLTHYQAKVESLHAGISKAEEKDKDVSPSKQAKSDRNDEKLREASEDYENNIRAFELYLERVTNSGWRDLVPIVYRLATWDVETSDDQAGLVSRLADVISGLHEIGDEHGFDPNTDCIEELKEDTSETLMRINNVKAHSAEESEISEELASIEE